uniref:Solute carrier family 25 member 40 n=1 Tax=Acrobeloides nanus TaxID=290746 RepID=A0A914DM38_9BILA
MSESKETQSISIQKEINLSNGQISVFHQLLASSCGSLLTALLMTPMDVVKVRLQTQVKPLARGDCFLFSNGLMDHLCVSCQEPHNMLKCEWYNRPGHFSGTLDAFIKISRTEGIRSLWSGLSPTILSAIPSTVFYFTVYDNMLYYLRRKFSDSVAAPLLAGALARAIAATLVSPLEMIRTKMQSEQHTFSVLRKSIKDSIRQDGIFILWRGLVPTLLRDIPFSAFYWACYETTKKKLLVSLNKDRTNFSISFMSGAFSGSIAAAMTTPFDVVKTQRQITLGKLTLGPGASSETNAVKNQSTLSVMKDILQRNGYRGLFAGLTPRVVRVAPSCAIMIGTYEYLKLLLSKNPSPQNIS